MDEIGEALRIVEDVGRSELAVTGATGQYESFFCVEPSARCNQLANVLEIQFLRIIAPSGLIVFLG